MSKLRVYRISHQGWRERASYIHCSPLPTLLFTQSSLHTHLSILHIVRTSDPLHLVSAFLNRIDQRSDITGDIVQEVDLGHS